MSSILCKLFLPILQIRQQSLFIKRQQFGHNRTPFIHLWSLLLKNISLSKIQHFNYWVIRRKNLLRFSNLSKAAIKTFNCIRCVHNSPKGRRKLEKSTKLSPICHPWFSNIRIFFTKRRIYKFLNQVLLSRHSCEHSFCFSHYGHCHSVLLTVHFWDILNEPSLRQVLQKKPPVILLGIPLRHIC